MVAFWEIRHFKALKSLDALLVVIRFALKLVEGDSAGSSGKSVCMGLYSHA